MAHEKYRPGIELRVRTPGNEPLHIRIQKDVQNVFASVPATEVSLGKLRGLANEFTRYATDGHYDLATILEVFSQSATILLTPEGRFSPQRGKEKSALSNQKKVARMVLFGDNSGVKGIEGYLQEMVIYSKTYLPISEENPYSVDYFKALAAKCNEQKQQLMDRAIIPPRSNLALSELVKYMGEVLNRPEYESVIPTLTAIPPGVPEFFRSPEAHIKKMSIQDLEKDKLPGTISEVIRMFEDMSEKAHRPWPNMWKDAYNGISLADIFSQSFSKEYVNNAWKFIASMPAGDILWIKLLGMLLSSNRVDTPLGEGEHPEMVKKLVLLQVALLTDFLTPSLTGEKSTSIFDAVLPEMLFRIGNQTSIFSEEITTNMKACFEHLPELLKRLDPFLTESERAYLQKTQQLLAWQQQQTANGTPPTFRSAFLAAQDALEKRFPHVYTKLLISDMAIVLDPNREKPDYSVISQSSEDESVMAEIKMRPVGANADTFDNVFGIATQMLKIDGTQACNHFVFDMGNSAEGFGLYGYDRVGVMVPIKKYSPNLDIGIYIFNEKRKEHHQIGIIHVAEDKNVKIQSLYINDPALQTPLSSFITEAFSTFTEFIRSHDQTLFSDEHKTTQTETPDKPATVEDARHAFDNFVF